MTAHDLRSAPGAAEPDNSALKHWWDSPFRTFQTNLREIDAGMDVQAALDAIQGYGADTWLLSVGGIIANHPSRLASQTVNPHLAQRPSGDLIGDATRAAHDRGIRVLARMDFSKIDAPRAERHPEWCFVSPRGEPQIYNGYRSVCPSGDYYQREMFEIVAEVLEKYPISGFFFNWMSFNEVDYSRQYRGVCHCEACLRGFAHFAPELSLPHGPEDAGYARWKEFSDGVLSDLHHRMQAHVRHLAPDAALIQGDRADITFHEANNAVGRDLWHQGTADAVDAARSENPARPVFVNAVAFVDMPYRWAGEDPRHLEQYAVQSIAHGAQPSTYIMGTPAHSPFPALERSGRITRFHRDHQQDYAGLVSIARTALVRPAGTARSRAEFEGWHSALSEAHIPAATFHASALATLDRARFDLVILPDLGALPDPAVRTLRRFVADGGAVIATGSSAWSGGVHQVDPDGDRVTLKAVFDTEESLRSLHLDIGASLPGPATDTTAAGPRGPVHVPALGEFRVLGTSGAPGADGGPTTDWPVLGRALYGPPEKCYGNEDTGHPGRVSWQEPTGGTVTVLPWLPGQALRELGLSAVGEALSELVTSTGGSHLRWDTTLPPHLRIVPGRSARGLLVHLLNRSGERPQRFVDPIPTAPAEIEIPCPAEPREVHALVADHALEWSWSAGTVHLRTPQIDVFEAIAIRF
ncbi:alpha-amylase family protein [Brachybacterium sp. FME24]|uniref:alpha-amylase family protein n=1 Tax=Brachybacterium sp. FME24 TaxID=2742605 RepID=UPI0018673E55|nr:alpha-amylase family protein [Brachybacterium sp. FME24]